MNASEQAVLEAKLPGKLRAFIEIEDDALGFDEPVYAINWFDTKTSWTYDFYNVLAVRSVRAVGGAPFFKGRLQKVLLGKEEHRRDVLLVVRYPALRNFKTMLENKYFLLVSILRMAAVKDFTFGFTKRRDEGAGLSPMDVGGEDSAVYGVHHFNGNAGIADEIIASCVDSNVEPFYAGKINAHISTGKVDAARERTPCLMDAIVILKAADVEALESHVQSERYQEFIGATQSSFFGVYDRLM